MIVFSAVFTAEDHMDCEDNAESAVQDIVESEFREQPYDAPEELIVTVHAPSSIAGTYAVFLETHVKAYATRQSHD